MMSSHTNILVPNDTSIVLFVYIHACLMIVSGALVIANARIGGLLMAIAMVIYIITRDNPMLAHSDVQWRLNLQNMLKDLAVTGAGILIYIKK
jgi:hypothetical protein